MGNVKTKNKYVRDKTEILFEVLCYCNIPTGRRIYNIINSCNLYYNYFIENILKNNNGLLDKISVSGYSGIAFRTTDKGIMFIKYYTKLINLMDSNKK